MSVWEHVDKYWKVSTFSRKRFRANFIMTLLAFIAILVIIILEMASLFPNFLNKITNISLVLVSALSAVLMHYFFNVIFNRLMPKVLDEIPVDFHLEAERVVSEDFGFYRENYELSVDSIYEEKGSFKLKIVLTSSIKKVSSHSRISFKHIIGPLECGSAPGLPEKVYCKIGTTEVTGDERNSKNEIEVPINVGIGSTEVERAEFYYDVGENDVSYLGNKHTCLSPISGGIAVRFRLPGYSCKVKASGEPGKNLKKGTDPEDVIFLHSEAVFPNQSFSWSIKKKEA